MGKHKPMVEGSERHNHSLRYKYRYRYGDKLPQAIARQEKKLQLMREALDMPIIKSSLVLKD